MERITKQGGSNVGLVEDYAAGGKVIDFGYGAPTASEAGWAKAAFFIDVTNGFLYRNDGSTTSTTWTKLVGVGDTAATLTVTAGTVTTLTSTTATVTTLVNTAINASAAAATLTVKANTAAAWSLTDGTTSLLIADTRSAVTVDNWTFDCPASQTLPTGATSKHRAVVIAAHTVTLAGTTQVTTVNQGATLFLGAPTYAQSGGAVTVDQVSTLHVAVPVAGSSVTITANRHISTGVTDCYLTSGGVWTDTACWESGKEAVVRGAASARDAIAKVIGRLTPATWKYREVAEYPGVDEAGNSVVHQIALNDRGRERVGIVYDDLPGELRAPGEERGVSPGVLASFALAAIRTLWDENASLRARLDRLEGVAL